MIKDTTGDAFWRPRWPNITRMRSSDMMKQHHLSEKGNKNKFTWKKINKNEKYTVWSTLKNCIGVFRQITLVNVKFYMYNLFLYIYPVVGIPPVLTSLL